MTLYYQLARFTNHSSPLCCAQPTAADNAAVTAITKLLEQQLGIEDREMALSMFEIARDLNDLAAFTAAIDRDFGSPSK